MKKRILSLLLAVVLCLSLLPTAALAEEGTGAVEEIKSITAVGDGAGNWLNGANWLPGNASNHMKETSA